MSAKVFYALFTASLIAHSSAIPAPVPIAPAELVVPGNITLPLLNPDYTYVEYFEGSYIKGKKAATINMRKVDAFSASSITQRADPDQADPDAQICVARTTYKYKVTGHGTWFTAWCHQSGAILHPGAQAGRIQAKSTSVTFSASANLAGALSKVIDASVGVTVEKTKSSGVFQGCNNNNKYDTTIWWQEKMGWAQTTVTATYVTCEGSATDTWGVHSDFPDPDNTGFRELIPGCGSKPSNQGPYCNFDADRS